MKPKNSKTIDNIDSPSNTFDILKKLSTGVGEYQNEMRKQINDVLKFNKRVLWISIILTFPLFYIQGIQFDSFYINGVKITGFHLDDYAIHTLAGIIITFNGVNLLRHHKYFKNN